MMNLSVMSSTERQQGAVLIVSLMLLLVMTLIGVTALQTTTLEEKMAGNLRDRETAFQAAEVALREGEDYLGGVALPEFNDANGLYQPNRDLWQTIDWTDNTKVFVSTAMDDAITAGVLSQAPGYYIEELSTNVAVGDSIKTGFEPPPESGNYRITAHGFGGSTAAEVVLQSTFRR